MLEKKGTTSKKRKAPAKKKKTLDFESEGESEKEQNEGQCCRVDEEEDSFGYSESEEEESEYGEQDYICGECDERFVEGETWIQCDNCNAWFHVSCTNQRKRRAAAINLLSSWTCQKCLTEK